MDWNYTVRVLANVVEDVETCEMVTIFATVDDDEVEAVRLDAKKYADTDKEWKNHVEGELGQASSAQYLPLANESHVTHPKQALIQETHIIL